MQWYYQPAIIKSGIFAEPIDNELITKRISNACSKKSLTPEEASNGLYLQAKPPARTYNFEDENIHILFKNGTVKDISEVDNALINQNLKGKIKKYYICYLRTL